MKNLLLLSFLLSGCLDTSKGACMAHVHIGNKGFGYVKKVIAESRTVYFTIQTDSHNDSWYGEPNVESKLDPFQYVYYSTVDCPKDKKDAPSYAPNMYKEFDK